RRSLSCATRRPSLRAVAGTVSQRYEVVPIEDVQPHPDHPRRGDVDRLAVSIDRNGFYGACVVQRSTGFILAGNHRWMAARARGLAEVPVIWVDVDLDQARRIMLADNRFSDLATYDEGALGALLAQVLDDSGDLIGTGYLESDLASLLSDLENFQPAEPPQIALDDRKVHTCPACGHRG